MQINFTTTHEFTDQDFRDIIDAAGYGINYWADSAVIDDEAKTYTVTGEDVTKEITYEDLGNAIMKIERGEAGVNDQRLIAYIRSGEIGDYDSEVGDCIIQTVMFGEVIMG